MSLPYDVLSDQISNLRLELEMAQEDLMNLPMDAFDEIEIAEANISNLELELMMAEEKMEDTINKGRR